MNLFINLITGAIVGYGVSRIMQTNSQLGLLIDAITGAVGAFLSGYFISPLLGFGSINTTITIPTMLVTLIGSAMMLYVVKVVHRDKQY
jgi:uncharacterized membrane protein YeaQ/YmgE (transglycosylase-associated protein family)